jgi:two-component system response regulator RegX3
LDSCKVGGPPLTRVLIIEDERPMAEAIKYSLEAEGMEADFATDGEAGLRQFENNSYDVLILDLMLPGIDGLDICKEIRRSSSMPIIMLTARDSEVDKVIGLELGADDYLTKPFSMRELLARIRAVRRRAEMPVSEGRLIDGGDVAIDVDRHEVIVRGQVVDIPLLEYRLLELFLKNKGKVLHRDRLVTAAWQGEFYGQPKTLDVHIRRLREKLEEDPANPCRIITVRGVGYRFEPKFRPTN